jgi:hypothetical protein
MISHNFLRLILEEDFQFFNQPTESTNQNTTPVDTTNPAPSTDSQFGPNSHKSRFFGDAHQQIVDQIHRGEEPTIPTDQNPDSATSELPTQPDGTQQEGTGEVAAGGDAINQGVDATQELDPAGGGSQDAAEGGGGDAVASPDKLENMKKLIIYDNLTIIRTKLIKLNLNKSKEVKDVLYHLNNVILFFNTFDYSELVSITNNLLDKISIKEIFDEKRKRPVSNI